MFRQIVQMKPRIPPPNRLTKRSKKLPKIDKNTPKLPQIAKNGLKLKLRLASRKRKDTLDLPLEKVEKEKKNIVAFFKRNTPNESKKV